jgi:hypothetical protein
MSDKAVRTAEMQRVIEQTIHAGISPQRTDDGLRIVCKTRSFDDYELELHLTAKAVESAKIADPGFELPKAPISLARYIASTSTLTTFPINTNFGKYFLNPKYSRLTTIILTEVSPLGSFNDGEHIYFEDLPARVPGKATYANGGLTFTPSQSGQRRRTASSNWI